MAEKKNDTVKKLQKLRKDLEQGTGMTASQAQVNLGFVLNDVGQALGMTVDERHQVVGESIPREDL